MEALNNRTSQNHQDGDMTVKEMMTYLLLPGYLASGFILVHGCVEPNPQSSVGWLGIGLFTGMYYLTNILHKRNLREQAERERISDLEKK